MRDHAYNLLRLRTASSVSADLPAPRPPVDFRPPTIGGGLAAVRAELFGSDPDAFYLEVRLRQYMTILHAGRFADHLTAYDPRITYLPLLRTPPPTAGVRATPLGHDRVLTVFGSPTVDDATGTSRRSCRVVFAAGPHFSLVWSPIAGGGGPQTTLVDAADVGSVPLPESALAAAAPTGAEDGDAWRIDSWAPPSRGPADVLAGVEALGEGPLRALFGVEAGEPYATYRNLFRMHDQLPDRLSGVLLALIRRVDDARRAG